MQNSFNNRSDAKYNIDNLLDRKPTKPSLISKIWSFIKAVISLSLYTAFGIALVGFIFMFVWGLSSSIFNIGKDSYWNTINFIVKNLSMPLFILFIILIIWIWRRLSRIGVRLINGHLFDTLNNESNDNMRH